MSGIYSQNFEASLISSKLNLRKACCIKKYQKCMSTRCHNPEKPSSILDKTVHIEVPLAHFVVSLKNTCYTRQIGQFLFVNFPGRLFNYLHSTGLIVEVVNKIDKSFKMKRSQGDYVWNKFLDLRSEPRWLKTESEKGMLYRKVLKNMYECTMPQSGKPEPCSR